MPDDIAVTIKYDVPQQADHEAKSMSAHGILERPKNAWKYQCTLLVTTLLILTVVLAFGLAVQPAAVAPPLLVPLAPPSPPRSPPPPRQDLAKTLAGMQNVEHTLCVISST